MQRTSPFRALTAAAVILAAGLGGYIAHELISTPAMPLATSAPPYGSSGPAPDRVASNANADQGEPAQAHAAAAGGSEIPETLPDISFSDGQGVTRHLTDWKGRPLLVNFWAPWCEPCREEIPLLEQLSRERARNGLVIVGVAVDSRAAVLDYARHAAIQYPLLIGERPGLQAVHALGLQPVFPFSVFVDARGRIVTLKVGKLRAEEAALILDRIEDEDRGRIDLDTARHRISDGMAKLAVARAQASSKSRL